MSKKYVSFLSDDIELKAVEGEKSELQILSMHGFASIKTVQNVITSPYTPGAQTLHIWNDQTFVKFELLIPKAKRDYYLHYFRVDSLGILTIKYGDVERFNEYIISESNVEQPTVCSNVTIYLTVRCAYPYWKDVDGFGQDLGEKVPLLHAGIVFEVEHPEIVAAYAKFDRVHAVSNTGERPVGIYLRIKTVAEAKNPVIKLIDEENQFIRVFTDLVIGDILEISTIKENGNLPTNDKTPFVTLNGVNILTRVDQFSSFFQISVGEHSITYDADEGADTLQLFLYRNWAWSWV